MASDNAKTVEQLKASQEQMTRLVAKASEQNLRPKMSAPPPRPIATATRKPVPTLPSQQTRERAQAPIQLSPTTNSCHQRAARPPMRVHRREAKRPDLPQTNC